MNQTNIDSIWALHLTLSMHQCLLTSGRMNGRGGSIIPEAQLEEVLGTLNLLTFWLKKDGLTDSTRACEFAVIELQKSHLDVSTAHAQIKHVMSSILGEFRMIKFLRINKDRSEFLDGEHLFGEAVFDAFPSAREDVTAAGNCLAVECCTASVFHLMRAAEYGLRALGNDRGIAIAKGFDIRLATWDDILKELEKAENEILNFPKTLAREEQFKFYHGALIEFRAFKNKFRNGVMHTRNSYDRYQALSAMTHVRKFMEILAEKITEVQTTPKIWV